jgi:hypothetical protein
VAIHRWALLPPLLRLPLKSLVLAALLLQQRLLLQ